MHMYFTFYSDDQLSAVSQNVSQILQSYNMACDT